MRMPGGFGSLVIGLTVLLVLSAVFLLARGGFSHFVKQEDPAEKIAAAQAAIAREDWEQAAADVRALREAHGDDPAVLRLTVDYLDKTGVEPLLQLQLLDRLRERGLTNGDDALRKGRAHVRNGDILSAREVLAELPAGAQKESEALKLKAAVLAQEGRQEKAHATRQQAQAAAAPSPSWTVTAGTDAAALDTLRGLVDRQDLSPAQAETLLQAFDKHPGHDLADHLSAVSALMRAAPARRAALLAQETRPEPERSLDDTMTLARWLVFEKEHDWLMRLAPEDTLLHSKELFPIVVQSMAESGRWNDMLTMFGTRSNLPMPVEGIHVWKALAASRLNPSADEAAHHLRLAITKSLAVKNHSVLRAAAQTAEDLRLWELAFHAYSTLAAETKGHELEMLEKCWRIAVEGGDLSRQIDTARRQHALRPTSGHFARRLDYLRLLLGDEIESAAHAPAGAAQPAFDDDDDVSLEALLQALKAYRLGDDRQLAAALRSMHDTSRLTPGQRAVYAGLLAAIGETSRAFQLAERIPAHSLVPQEKVFLRKAL